MLKFSICRYNSDKDNQPYMQDYFLRLKKNQDLMVLDALISFKEQDPSLSFRRSCREGVCGSDALNINGKNRLACITPISDLIGNKKEIVIRPLPGLPIIRDLVVDMSVFYLQYAKARPYLISNNETPHYEYLQSPKQRKKLDGLYECILCGCCSTSCPSFWWNPDKFLGPAALLTVHRFIVDSRDTETDNRLEEIKDIHSVFRCHNIMNCIDVCPKGLNPTQSINYIKLMLLDKD